MKRYTYLIILVFVFLSCGSPRFEIDNSNEVERTFTLSYFYPTTEYSQSMKVDMPIIFIFSENIDVDSAIRGLSIEKTGPDQKENVKPKCIYNEIEMMLQCLPDSGKWKLKSNYSVKIKEVKSRDGSKTLDKEYSFVFSTI